MILIKRMEKLLTKDSLVSKIGLAVLISFFIFYIISRTVIVMNRSMWFDELQAWNIARYSNNLTELYQNISYEAHPPLWHLTIYPITKVFEDPHILKTLNILLMALAIGIFIFLSPFSKLEKILFMFGYVPFFEYIYFSRTYSLFLLLAFLGIYFYTKFNKEKNNKYFVLSIFFLSLLTATHLLGAIFTFSIGFFLFASQIKKSMHLKDFWIRKHLLVTTILLIFAAGVSYNTIILPEDFYFPIWKTYDSYSLYRVIETFDISFGSIFTELFSEGKVFGPKSIYAILFIYFFTFNIFLFRKNKSLLFSYILGTITFYLFLYIKDVEARHISLLFVFTLCCFWIYRSNPNINNSNDEAFHKIHIAITVCILALQAIHGVSMDVSNRNFDISNAKLAADFIKTEGYQDAPILCESIGPCSSVATYLDKTPWFIGANKYEGFVLWHYEYMGLVTEKDLLNSISIFRKNEGLKDEDVVIIIKSQGPRVIGDHTERIGSFANITIKSENFYVYRNVIKD